MAIFKETIRSAFNSSDASPERHRFLKGAEAGAASPTRAILRVHMYTSSLCLFLGFQQNIVVKNL